MGVENQAVVVSVSKLLGEAATEHLAFIVSHRRRRVRLIRIAGRKIYRRQIQSGEMTLQLSKKTVSVKLIAQLDPPAIAPSNEIKLIGFHTVRLNQVTTRRRARASCRLSGSTYKPSTRIGLYSPDTGVLQLYAEV